jgi:hypothetical protein
VALAPSSATAADYEVLACGAAPANANASWTATNTNVAKVQTSSACGAGGDYGGLVARDVLGVPSTGTAGANAFWSFTAPAGTTIAALTYDRLLASFGDSGWLVQLRRADGTVLEDCSDAPPGSDTCTLGTRGGGGYVTVPAASTTRLDFGVWCIAGCGTGATINRGEAVIYRARVVVNDPTAPTVSALGGAIASGGWLRGTQPASFTASDAQSGVRTLRLSLDGTPVQAAAQACDFTLSVPCAQGTVPYAAQVDTTQLADGEHTLRAQALDASDAVGQSGAVTIRTDNTAPASAALSTAEPRSSTAQRAVNIAPAAADAGSPVVARRLRVCPAAGGACTVEQDLDLAQRTVAVDLPSIGAWTVRTWDVDAAGNESPASASTLTLERVAPAPPPAPPAPPAPPTPPAPPAPPLPPAPAAPPTAVPKVSPGLRISVVRRTRSTLRVSGRLAKGSGPVRLTLRVRDRKTRKLRTLKATARVRNGRWSVSLRLPSTVRSAVRGRTVKVTVAPTSTTKSASVSRRV